MHLYIWAVKFQDETEHKVLLYVIKFEMDFFMM